MFILMMLVWNNPAMNAVVPMVTGPIEVDGRLDEVAWRQAIVVSVHNEWFPGDNLPAVVDTECLVMFSETHLYIGFKAQDPDPTQIRAYLADRDDAFSHDTVGFMVDTFHDKRRAYQFRINPLGVQMDAINDDVSGNEDWSWDAIWDSAGKINSDGYVVEVAIPFKQLRFPSGETLQTWGFMATRDYPRNVRHRFRSQKWNRDENCLVCQFDSLTGFQNMASGKNLQITPTLTGSRSDIRDDGVIENGDPDGDLGGTVRWSITPNITLNGAVNPDFSQIEADALQLDVNNRFALYFPEKRPFFLEGSDMFSTPIDSVFTRSMAEPKAGLKLTGKQGKHAFGVILAEDKQNNLILPSYDGSEPISRQEDVTHSILRYRTDIGSSNVGFMYTGRRGDQYQNESLGVDGRVRIGKSDSIRFQAVGSRTEYGEDIAQETGQIADAFEGAGFRVNYAHSGDKWSWYAGADDHDKDLRLDSGFLNQVDWRGGYVSLNRRVDGGKDKWFRQLNFEVAADHVRKRDGSIKENGMDIGVQYDGPMQSYLSIYLAPNDEHFDGTSYDHFRSSIYGEFQPHSRMQLFGQYRFGETIDYTNNQSADFKVYYLGSKIRLGRHFEATLELTRQDYDVESGPLFDADLVYGKLQYNFSQRMFIRGIIQLRDVQRDLAQYPDDYKGHAENEVQFGQFLFSYKINPQTVALAGYSSNAFGDDEIALATNDRNFFFKIGYAWIP